MNNILVAGIAVLLFFVLCFGWIVTDPHGPLRTRLRTRRQNREDLRAVNTESAAYGRRYGPR